MKGKHRIKRVTYKIGYGDFVLYGHLWFKDGMWYENTVERGTWPRFDMAAVRRALDNRWWNRF